MSLASRILAYVRSLRQDPIGEYEQGYQHAVDDIESFTEEAMWEAGVDDDE